MRTDFSLPVTDPQTPFIPGTTGPAPAPPRVEGSADEGNTTTLDPRVAVAVQSGIDTSQSLIQRSLDRAVAHLKCAVPEVEVVDSTENSYPSLNTEQTALTINSAFREEVRRLGNPYDMLARSFVYTLTEGTHEEKKVAEYEYATAQSELISGRLAKAQVTADIEILLDRFSKGLITRSDDEDTEMALEIKKRLKQSLYEIGTNMMNRSRGSTAKGRRVIANIGDTDFDSDDPKDGTEDVNIAILAITADPEHWGQTETALRAMAQMKIDQVLVVVQGFDQRKPRTRLTEAERHEMTKMRMKEFGGLLIYSDWERGNEKIGEESFQEMILRNKDRRGKVTWHYLVGNDHMHYYAPNNDSKDASGVRREPKAGAGADGFEPDTIQRLETMTELSGIRELIDAGKVEVKIGFNVREDEDGVAMEQEEAKLEPLQQDGFYYILPGRNLEGVSSTKIRNALTGQTPLDEVSFMTKSVFNFIKENSLYRGLITELPSAVKLLAKKTNGERVDDAEIRRAAEQLRHWMKIEEDHNHRFVGVREFHEMFVPETELELADIQKVFGLAFADRE